MTTINTLPSRLSIGELDFTVRVSASRRTVGITVDRDGSLLLHAPAGAGPDAVAAWAESKRAWVSEKLAAKDMLLSNRPAKEIVSGEGFQYLGRHHQLLVRPGAGPEVKLDKGRLSIDQDLARSGGGATALIDWYRRRGLAWLPGRVAGWERRMGVQPATLDVRDIGNRWGSLGTASRLNIHWATLQLPPSLIDYVIVHELGHIEYPHHTPQFWVALRRALPDYESRKARLADVGSRLWLGR
jgi:predicted metal-dependent hydrolase